MTARPAVLRLALACAGLLLALALGEGLVRWLVPAGQPDWERIHWWREFVQASAEPLLLWELVPRADIEGRGPGDAARAGTDDRALRTRLPSRMGRIYNGHDPVPARPSFWPSH